MRKLRGVGTAVFTVVLAFLVSACSPQEPAATPRPSDSSTPVFASEADALAAATKAYAAYLAVANEILASGGHAPERIQEQATGEALQNSLDGYKEFASKGLHATGLATFHNAKLQHYSARASKGIDIVGMYVCQDVADVDVVDGSGRSVVPSSRPDLQPLELSFDLHPKATDNLLLSSISPWKGGAVCDEK